MISIDTNVLVRLIAGDDEKQFLVAQALLDRGQVFVSLPTFMEAEWVLRKRYNFEQGVIIAAFRNVLALDAVVAELEDFAVWALDRMERGADLADMVLLIAARHTETFVTFDRRIARDAGESSPVRVEVLA